jgi:DnaJ-class molecular chaperone
MKPYRQKRCVNCRGTGEVWANKLLRISKTCRYCEGSGVRDSDYWECAEYDHVVMTWL